MSGRVQNLHESGAVRVYKQQIGALTVSTLADGTSKCFDHKEAIKTDGFRWNSNLKQWGKSECTAEAKPKVLELLQAGALIATEEADGVVAIANGFGTTYDFRTSLKNANFWFNPTSKTYSKQASDKERSAVEEVNKIAAAQMESACKARKRACKRKKKQTFREISDAIDRNMDAYFAEKRATCYAGMPFQPTYRRRVAGNSVTTSNEEYSRWLAHNKDFISNLPVDVCDWTAELDLECQQRGIDVRVDRSNALVCVEYPR